MPLDPQARAVLEQLSLDIAIDPAQLDPQTMRAGYELLSGTQSRDPVGAVEDRTIPGPAGEIPIRIFRPAGDAAPPGLVYFHGGGWVAGSIETHDGTCRKLCNAAGCTVVSVGYRLAPEAKFPAAAEDAYAALNWVAAHGSQIGVDPERLAVGGDSAGGNLATVTTLMARERGGPALRHQLLIYPVTDRDFETGSYRENAEGYVLSRALMIWFWEHYFANESDARNAYAAPLQALDLSGLPPALVITAELDPLRDEGEAYAERLRAAGVPTVCTRYDGMFHGFFSMSDAIDRSKQALGQAAESLRKAFAS